MKRQAGASRGKTVPWTRFSVVCFVLMLVWMTVIFLFSAQAAEESAAPSNWLADRLARLLRFWYDGLSEPRRQLWYSRFTFLIRKTAHMSEYAVLAALALFWLRGSFGLSERKNAALAFLFSTVYAATDEFHQTFVAGRAGRLIDVLIDASGAALAIFLLAFVVRKMQPSARISAKNHNRERNL